MNTVDRGRIGPEEISTFSRVDAAGNPDSLVQFLDETAAMHFSRINRRSLELMALREGASALDIGCGTGDDVRAMRKMVGAQGAATGVDLSERMLDEALVRDQASLLRSRFLVADAQQLPFPDGSFDACRASRLLLHVTNAELALEEAIRVIRPGGRLVLIEPDFGTMALAHPDHGMTRTVLNAFCDSFVNGTVGRWLTLWLKARGMDDLLATHRAPADLIPPTQREHVLAQLVIDEPDCVVDLADDEAVAQPHIDRICSFEIVRLCIQCGTRNGHFLAFPNQARKFQEPLIDGGTVDETQLLSHFAGHNIEEALEYAEIQDRVDVIELFVSIDLAEYSQQERMPEGTLRARRHFGADTICGQVRGQSTMPLDFIEILQLYRPLGTQIRAQGASEHFPQYVAARDDHPDTFVRDTGEKFSQSLTQSRRLR
ncbi:MAG TPA: methyltransferase domain-containing protein [Steroidobacteraceae bacterium]|nr:methyltransferase domain-containing protein [Steroidobacteraceae bacterium]